MAHNSTVTRMGNQAQQQQTTTEWRGPEIYLHLEFRVAWSKKQQPAKNHQVTYRSRNARERTPAFPRQVPATNTNYLAAIHDFDQRQARTREFRQSHLSRHHQLQEYYQEEERRGRATHQQQIPVIREPEHRQTRAESRPSHERGSSAPPPFGENPWDVSVGGGGYETPKALPAVPSQFRLGEGGEPWSTWSLPPGFDPDTLPQDDHDELEQHQQRPRNSMAYATNPTMVSTFSPEPATSSASHHHQHHHHYHVEADPVVSATPPAPRADTTGRVRELEALSAAMMTVDNGFENQWWYQGQRARVGNKEEEIAVPERADTPESTRFHRWSTGPFEDDNEVDDGQLHHDSATQTLSEAQTGLVSPMTENALSPAPVFATLHRSLSTRSEELWFADR
ncbi:hypothetical protein QBC35DRAFT_218693 [Podospora australis]|uniref:Uncharacterized protein n=1 Tax=Podospora australis TaxID=1536484 RepID=A0AAN7AJF8_9PEZI|nr:hypothetical protein QBC35DRAFT_218693 [Podospora australis]